MWEICYATCALWPCFSFTIAVPDAWNVDHLRLQSKVHLWRARRQFSLVQLAAHKLFRDGCRGAFTRRCHEEFTTELLYTGGIWNPHRQPEELLAPVNLNVTVWVFACVTSNCLWSVHTGFWVGIVGISILFQSILKDMHCSELVLCAAWNQIIYCTNKRERGVFHAVVFSAPNYNEVETKWTLRTCTVEHWRSINIDSSSPCVNHFPEHGFNPHQEQRQE